MARARSRSHSTLQRAIYRMGHGFAVQKAVDPLTPSGVHGRHRSGEGAHKACRRERECFGRRSRIGLYVLANTKAQVRLVSRARLRSRLCVLARTVVGIKRRAVDRVPVKALG